MVCELHLTKAAPLKCKRKRYPANLLFSFLRAQLVNFEDFQGSKSCVLASEEWVVKSLLPASISFICKKKILLPIGEHCVALGSQFILVCFYPFIFFFQEELQLVVWIPWERKRYCKWSFSILCLDLVITGTFHKTFTLSLHSSHIILLNLCNNSMRSVLLLFPFAIWENWGWEWCSDLQ